MGQEIILRRQATGLSRTVDSLGRVVIPKDIRDEMGLEPSTLLEVYVDLDGAGAVQGICFRRFERGCNFCGSLDNLAEFRGKPVCATCRREVGEIGGKR